MMMTRRGYALLLVCVGVIFLLFQSPGYLTNKYNENSNNNNNKKQGGSSNSGIDDYDYDYDDDPRQELPPISDDIVSILHHPQESKIVVTMNSTTNTAQPPRCPRPYLIGRLSGPTLIKLQDWRWRKSTTNNNIIMEATYRAPVAGYYFLEILAVYCDHYFYDFFLKAEKLLMDTTAHQSNNNNNWLADNDNAASPGGGMAKLLEFDFKPICMEAEQNFKITPDNSAILVTQTTTLSTTSKEEEEEEPPGFWYNKNWKISPSTDPNPSISTSASPLIVQKPLYTRYQPLYCYQAHLDEIQPMPPSCLDPTAPVTGINRFDDYEFQWRNLPFKSVSNNLGRLILKPTTVCIVGASHGRHLYDASLRLGINATTTNITIDYIEAAFPQNVTPQLILNISGWETDDEQLRHHKHQCNKLLIGLGQHEASYKGPTLLSGYYQHLKRMLNALQANEYTRNIEIYMRSIHYNGLAGAFLKCPPDDWRNPLVIEGYNVVTRHVANEMNVTFVDATPIIGPVWDCSPDWCHFPSEVDQLELLYLLDKIVQHH